MHAVVARSTFRSEHEQRTPFSDHFWKLSCRKSARRCGAKHISEVNMYKTPHVRATFGGSDVEKCTPLWREAHFQVKMHKTPHVRYFWRFTFGGSDVEKVHAVVARSTFPSQNVKNTRGSDHFWRFRCRFASLHYNTLHYTTIHYTKLHYTTLHYITLHYTALLSTTLHYITLHYTPLHYNYTYDHTTTLHYTKLHYTTLHSTTLYYITLNDTAPQIDR